MFVAAVELLLITGSSIYYPFLTADCLFVCIFQEAPQRPTAAWIKFTHLRLNLGWILACVLNTYAGHINAVEEM